MGYVLALWGEFVKFTGGRAGLVHLLLFAAALVCCFFLGKEERHRLFWPSVLVGIFFFQPGVLQICGHPLLKRGVLAAAVDASVDVRDRLCGGKDGVPAWKAGTAHCCGGGGMCLYLRDREAGFIGGDLRGAVECVRTAAGSS